MSARASESTRAIQEVFETRFLARCNSSQTNAAANLINGFAHRIASAVATVGSENTITLAHLIAMKLAFDKANVPMAGRIGILDPVTAATFNKLITITNNATPFGEQLLQNGFSRDHAYVMNLYGWDLITSNRLAKGSFGDGTTTVTNGVANVFMSVADDNTKPIMAAWRRMPKVEGERNKDLRRDEFVTSARWGFGTQRVDTLGIIITDAVKN